MITYKEKYKNFDKRTMMAVKDLLFTKKFYQQDLNSRFVLLQELLLLLNNIYGTKTLLNKRDNDGFSDFYNHKNKTMFLAKPSLVTFLHEFKHGMQEQKSLVNSEEVARGWSISLFCQASPKHYNNAVRKGLLLFK